MTKELQDVIEDCGWIIHKYEDEIELEQSSPCGEDFVFSIGKKTPARDIAMYAENFDPDEHAEMWVEFRGQRGVPNSIRALIDDADAIQEMLDELAEAVYEFME